MKYLYICLIYFDKTIKKPIAILALLVLTIVSCKPTKETVEKVENEPKISGVVRYTIDYPSLFGDDDGLIRMFLPKYMDFSYKDDLFKTEIKNKKVFSTSFIGDSKDESMQAGTQYFYVKNNCDFSLEDKDKYMASQPTYRIETTDKTKEIIGYQAKHAYAINKENKDTVNIYYTNEIDIKSPNWFTAYYDIKGVLLEYEIERYGLRMKFSAKETLELPSDAQFGYDSSYVELSYEKYNTKIESYFKDLIK